MLLALTLNSFSQTTTFKKEEITINPLIKGSLYSALKQNSKTDLVILIAGSGPTDRDGNQSTMKNNSLRYLSEELAKKRIDVFSFDKRIFAQMASGKINEKELSFDNLIGDVQDIILYFKAKKQYRKIIIAGHSEGSLIGMIAANGNADAYISLAGAGRTIDFVLEEQIEKQAPQLKEEIRKDLDLLKKGETFELKNPMLASLFRESVQPYMISWIKYNPQDEIKKLHIPVLIINGTKDMQVNVSEAELLKKAKPEAQLEIITDMNHIFKEVKADDTASNLATYSNPDLPVKPELVLAVNQFIKSL